MTTFDVRDSGVPFKHSYTLGDGVVLPVLHPREVELLAGEGLDGEEAQVRAAVAATLPASRRSLLDELPLFVVMEMHAAYQGWCAAYMLAIKQRAAGAALEASQPLNMHAPSSSAVIDRTAEAATPQIAGSAKQNQVRFPRQRVVPGGTLPSFMGGHTVGRARSAADGAVEITDGVGEPFPLRVLEGQGGVSN